MTFETRRKPFMHHELHELRRAPAAPGDPPEMRLYVLLPSLEELLGVADFGRRGPIVLPHAARPLDGWALFGSLRERGLVLH